MVFIVIPLMIIVVGAVVNALLIFCIPIVAILVALIPLLSLVLLLALVIPPTLVILLSNSRW
jgi:hypothetical protein